MSWPSVWKPVKFNPCFARIRHVLCLRFAGRRDIEWNEFVVPFCPHFAYLSSAGAASSQRRPTYQEYQVTIRLACASTFTMLGLACSSTASARVTLYLSVPVIYAPPRPVDYPAPVPVSLSAVAAAAAVAIVVPAPISYSVVPSPTVTYAQPLLAVPR
jgi:hypothetical protein